MKKAILLTVIAIGFVFIAQNASAIPIFSPVTGNYYEAISGTYDWTTANSNAISKGGHLVTLTSQAENDWVWANVITGGNPAFYWLGGYQDPAGSEPSGGWKWVTGETWSYANWNGGEPSESTPPGNEDYLQLWNNGAWNDINGNSANTTYGTGSNAGNKYYQGYIVEYPAVPEPTLLSVLSLSLFGLIGFRRKR